MATAPKTAKSKYRVLVPYTAAIGHPVDGAKFGDTVEIADDDPRLENMLEAGTIGDDAAYEKELDEYLIPGTGKGTDVPARYWVNESGALKKRPAAYRPVVGVELETPAEPTEAVVTPDAPPAL